MDRETMQRLIDGTDFPAEAPIPLRAGALTMFYEAGDIRRILYNDHELIRRVYFALRDDHWGTIAGRIRDFRLDVRSETFEVSYTSDHQQGAIHFVQDTHITGEADGKITITFAGEAHSTFETSRLGLCILIPAAEGTAAAGRIEHIDGTIETAILPDTIVPQAEIDGVLQPVHPFSEMRAFSYEAAPGINVEIRFEGEIFELEDQRNWGDASFKIYGTPLRIPFPKTVTAGTKISQTITLRVTGIDAKGSSASRFILKPETPTAPIAFTLIPSQTTPLPALGLSSATGGSPLSDEDVERLKGLALTHLRVPLALNAPNWRARLERAATDARALEIPLSLALFLESEDSASLDELLTLLNTMGGENGLPIVAQWEIYGRTSEVTPEAVLQMARARLNIYHRQALWGIGSASNFTAINAHPPTSAALGQTDFLAFRLYGQEHANDNRTLLENPAAAPDILRSARALSGGEPIAINSIALRGAAQPDEETVDPGVNDPRLHALIGAIYTVEMLRGLTALPDVSQITTFETTGALGVMDEANVYPVYHVLADVGAMRGGSVIAVEVDTAAWTQSREGSSTPLIDRRLRPEALALLSGDRVRVIFANPQPEACPVILRGLGGAVKMRSLDAESAEMAMRDPAVWREGGTPLQITDGVFAFTLPPYSIVTLE